jgi:hypothetical protein
MRDEREDNRRGRRGSRRVAERNERRRKKGKAEPARIIPASFVSFRFFRLYSLSLQSSSALQRRNILFSWQERPKERRTIEPKKTKEDAKKEQRSGLVLLSLFSLFFVSFG